MTNGCFVAQIRPDAGRHAAVIGSVLHIGQLDQVAVDVVGNALPAETIGLPARCLYPNKKTAIIRSPQAGRKPLGENHREKR